ncbi:MAG: hypothetical protein WAM28_02740, partial [Chlamydiales bacterium]
GQATDVLLKTYESAGEVASNVGQVASNLYGEVASNVGQAASNLYGSAGKAVSDLYAKIWN